MRIMQMTMLTFFAATLVAQGSDQGFRWVGLRAGSLSFDPQENVNAAAGLGGQLGMVFDQQRYGLSVEGLTSRPKSNLFPGQSLSHSEASVTLLTGLSSDASSKFWPYLGLGLGGVSIPKISPATLASEATKGVAAHASLGFLHRPAHGFIWGGEARYLLTFTPKDLRETQASVMVGFTWGGPQARRSTEASVPPAEVAAPLPAPPHVVVAVPPPPPPPIVVAAPPPPPPPVVMAVPPPIPRPVVETPARPPAPLPVVVEIAPPPPPPPPALARLPLPAAPEKGTKVTEARSTLTERLDALRQGDMAKALELGRARIQAIPPQGWTIRLEIANLPSTLQHAVEAFPAGKPDLFIAPIKLRGGKIAYQLFLGEYASKAAAERAARAVPSQFLEGGQRPKPLLGAAIPTQVNTRN